MPTESILRLLAAAEDAKNTDELLRGFETALSLYDFDSWLLLRHSAVTGNGAGVMAGKTAPGSSLTAESLSDAVLWRLRTGIGGFRIRDVLRDSALGRKRRNRKNINGAAIHLQWADGYAFPIHTGRGFAGSMAMRGERALSALDMKLFEIMAHTLFWRFVQQKECHGISEPGDLSLTRRESEVLAFLADGMTSNEIGRTLKISTHTVDWYMNGLQDKFSARNRPHLLALAFRMGLVN